VKRLVALALAVALVVAGALLVQSVRIQRQYGDWGLTAPAAPARIHVLGRDYDRADLPPVGIAPGGLRVVGETDGGGSVLAARSFNPPPLIVYVDDGNGRLWTYALVGGP
jgi:hypothetical protein